MPFPPLKFSIEKGENRGLGGKTTGLLWRLSTASLLPSVLHGIPILVKDSISTVGMNNTAGSYCLVGAKTRKEASLIARLRKAGAIVLGKANMSEWGNGRSSGKHQSNGWSAWGGQTYGAYHDIQDPCGSSSGSAVALTLGLAAATIGVEVSIRPPTLKALLTCNTDSRKHSMSSCEK